MSSQIVKKPIDEVWYWYLTGQKRDGFTGQFEVFMKLSRGISRLLPGEVRCFQCSMPLNGFGSLVLALFGIRPSSFSSRLCNICERVARREEGGAEVELSMLFVDVRGSTTSVESMHAYEFKNLIQKFYRCATDVLIKHDGMVNRLMGDQVIGLFVPRFAGSSHGKVAVEAALDIMRATGHGNPEGPWIPVGVGVHTGSAYVGSVGNGEGVNEIAVLGNAANLAARLSPQAADGEVLVSEDAFFSAQLTGKGTERRNLSLKGVSREVPVHVVRVEAESINSA